MFYIPEIAGDANSVNALPPYKGARPGLDFKEIEAQHLVETVYFPGKPNWKPISLTLYDLKTNSNPIFNWIKRAYDPSTGEWNFSVQTGTINTFKLTGILELYDGCGKVIEMWYLQNIWPQSIEYGDLDMANSDYMSIDLTLRYDRAINLI